PDWTMTLVASLIQRTGAEVVCCYAKRRSDRQGFDICLRPAVDALKDAGDEVAATTAVNASVEDCVSDCFEQYQWGYKRFREREDSSISLYLKDRRLQYRRRLGNSVAVVYESDDGNGSGALQNLTPGGLMLSTVQPLTAGTTYRIRLSLPGNTRADITAEARCLWSRVVEEAEGYWSGMLTTFMPQQDALRLLEWLEQYEQKPWPVRLIWPLLETCARLPLFVMERAGYCLGSTEYWLKTRRYRYTETNICSAFPDSPEGQRWIRESL